MKLFAILFGCVISGGQILSVPNSRGLLSHDGVSYLQTLTGKANLRTKTDLECSDICKVLNGGNTRKCNSWIYDSWTLECHLFKNSNPDFVKIPENLSESNDLIKRLLKQGHTSFPTYRFKFGTSRRTYSIRNLRFGRATRHKQYQAAKFLTGEFPEWEMNRYSTLVPSVFIAPNRVPLTSGETFESVAIWWVNEPECSQICESTVGCKAWTYVKNLSGGNNFEGCFLHEKIAMAKTEKCYSGFKCSFGLNSDMF